MKTKLDDIFRRSKRNFKYMRDLHFLWKHSNIFSKNFNTANQRSDQFQKNVVRLVKKVESFITEGMSLSKDVVSFAKGVVSFAKGVVSFTHSQSIKTAKKPFHE